MALSTNNMIIGEDRISVLPDSLIHHILSLIDTQDAVRTCVLSKRWIDIWKSLPFLNFNVNRYGYDPTAFRRESLTVNDFVDRVLLLRDDCSIQSLTVSWCIFYNYELISSVHRWIDAAVKHNVQEVSIELGQDSDITFEIPHKLLNCKSLKKLKLRVYCGKGSQYADVILPKSISLPQLKFMHLDGFLMPDVDLWKRLFSSCPVLETLNIVDCDIGSDNESNFTVESLSLKQFAYTCEFDSGDWFYNYDPTPIRLSTPNLKNFTCKSDWKQDYNLENCSDQLSHVNINILYPFAFEHLRMEEKEVYARRMLKLLVAVDKVKQLELSPGFLEVLSKATNLVNCQLLYLCNLQFLRLETSFTRRCLHAVAYLLTVSPNIKTLILTPNAHEDHESDLADTGDDWEEGFSLPGMLSHLKLVRIENAEGLGVEFKVLRYLMNNAKGLEEIAVYPCATVASRRTVRKQYEYNLTAFPRSSSRIRMRWSGKKSTCLI